MSARSLVLGVLLFGLLAQGPSDACAGEATRCTSRPLQTSVTLPRPVMVLKVGDPVEVSSDGGGDDSRYAVIEVRDEPPVKVIEIDYLEGENLGPITLVFAEGNASRCTMELVKDHWLGGANLETDSRVVCSRVN